MAELSVEHGSEERRKTDLTGYFSSAESTVTEAVTYFASTQGTVRGDLSVAGLDREGEAQVRDWIRTSVDGVTLSKHLSFISNSYQQAKTRQALRMLPRISRQNTF